MTPTADAEPRVFPSADSLHPSYEVVDQPDRAELEKQLEVALEKAVRQAHQARGPSHPGETFYAGGKWCPGQGGAPKGGVLLNSQGQPVQAREHTEASSSDYPRRRNSHPSSTFHRGDFWPGGGEAPNGWGYRHSSQHKRVDCSARKTPATMKLESGGQNDSEAFDGLHDDYPPARAEREHSPAQRDQFQDDERSSSSGVAHRELENRDRGDKVGSSQVEPQQARKREAGVVQRDSVPGSNVAQGESSASAVKWVLLEHEAGELRTTKQAGHILSTVPEDQVVNVLTIVGAAKQGKSFLMNALTGSDNVFPVSPAPTACTAGADLSPILMPLPEFKKGGGGVTTSSSCQPPVTIAFVDMEGQGDKSPEHDVRLATPFLLVSKVNLAWPAVGIFGETCRTARLARTGCAHEVKHAGRYSSFPPPSPEVVIFNWSGLPNKDTILQQLVVMLNAAEKVAPGNEHERTFGHLILVFRDVTGKAAEIEALVLGEEDTGTYPAGQIHISGRNRIRQGLKAAFKSVAIHTMPNPHPNIGGDCVHHAPRHLTNTASDYTRQ